ncbi:hypothetical protein RI129_003907 [Pyrocoelia pectoralis]|uniref:Pheromone biosynthesis activating neuropeptide n=1 Tax=Pyrocoelia pectoralis TaxID=417401 RepID=A0AAN7VHN6_9COLE
MRLSLIFTLAVLKTVSSRPEMITRDTKVELPGSEKINRRSPQEYFESTYDLLEDNTAEKIHLFTKRSDNSMPKPSDDMMAEENSLVFRPLFHTKLSRTKPRAIRSTDGQEKEDEMKSAETGIVYVPLFGARDRGRARRSAGKQNDEGVIGTPYDLETAEDIVFRPLFRHKHRASQSGSDSIFGSRLVFQNQYS